MKLQILVSLLATFASAGPNFHLSDDVVRYHGFQGHRHHRSGLSREDRATLDAERGPSAAASTVAAYLEVDSTGATKAPEIPALERHLRGAGFQVGEGHGRMRAEASPQGLAAGLGPIDPEAPEKIARRLAEAILPRTVSKQVDFSTVARQYRQNVSGLPVLTKYVFRYYRVVDERILRSGDDFVSIEVTPDSKVLGVEVAWEKLRRSRRTMEVAGKDSTSVEYLHRMLESGYAQAANASGETFQTSDYHVKGVADAWCRLSVDGRNMLVPCESYQVKLTATSGEQADVIVDAPIAAKY